MPPIRKPPAKPFPKPRAPKRQEGLDLRHTGEPYPIRVGGRYRIEVEPTIEVSYKKLEMAEKLGKAYPAFKEFLKEHPESIDQIAEMLEKKFREQIKEQEKREATERKINEAFERIGWAPFDRPTEITRKAKDIRIKTPEAVYESWRKSLERELLSFQASLEVQQQYIKRLEAEIKHRRSLGSFIVSWIWHPYESLRGMKLWKRRTLQRARKTLENNKRLTQAWNDVVKATIKSLEKANNKFKEGGFDPDPVRNAELCVQEFQRILKLHNENISFMRYLLLGKPYLKKHKKQVGSFGTIELSQGFYEALNRARQMDKKRLRALVAAGEEHSRRRRHELAGSPS